MSNITYIHVHTHTEIERERCMYFVSCSTSYNTLKSKSNGNGDGNVLCTIYRKRPYIGKFSFILLHTQGYDDSVRPISKSIVFIINKTAVSSVLCVVVGLYPHFVNSEFN